LHNTCLANDFSTWIDAFCCSQICSRASEALGL
jgi:hypothetical protein